MKLTDICDFQGGSQPPKSQWSDEQKDGYIRMLQIRDYTQENSKVEYIKATNSTKTCKEDDILIARYGASLGKILTGLSGAYNVAMMKVIIDENKVDRNFIYNFLKSNIFQNYIKNVGERSAQAGFNKDELSKIEISLPILKEQKKIANKLDKVQEIIDLRKKQIDELDKLIESQFVEMFGDVLTNSKKYEQTKLDEIALLRAGKSINKNKIKKEYFKGSYPCYGGNGIRGYVDTYSDEGNIPLIGRQGALCGNVQLCSGKFYATEHAVRVIPFKEINTYWLYFTLKMLNLNRLAIGVAQPGLTIEKLNKELIPIIDIKDQKNFESFVQLINKQKYMIRKSLKEIEKLQECLMNKYFGGKI